MQGRNQIAITLFRQEVQFEKKDSAAQLFVALAASDSDSHVEALMTISEILQDEEKVKQILQSENAETLYSFFN